MPKVTANGVSLYYERSGCGTPLLFISGSGADLRNRPNQFDTPLASKFDLISYDQRGLGRSDNPAGTFSMADYADDAAGLLSALGLGPLPIVGVSFGGMVAQELALRHPGRVSKLVLACTSAGGAGGASYPLHELQALDDQQRAPLQLRIADTRVDEDWLAAHPERVQFVIDLARTNRRRADGSDGADKQLQARRGHDTFARLPELRMPVLLMAGLYDGIAPPANMEALRAQIEGSELRFFEGGHLFLIQDKSAYAELAAWL